MTLQCTFAVMTEERDTKRGRLTLCFSVMCSVFNPYAREINIWEPQQ